jgi:uncharacterized protein YccT (UPF0319 family)
MRSSNNMKHLPSNILQPLSLIIISLSAIALSACTSNQEKGISFDNGTIPLTVPSKLEIYELDGKTILTPSNSSGNYTIYITPNRHTLAIQYVSNWNTGSDGDSTAGRIVKWQPVVFDVSFDNDKTYFFSYKKPNNFEEASEMKSAPEIFLHDNSNNVVQGQVMDTPSAIEALMSGRFRYGTPTTNAPNTIPTTSRSASNIQTTTPSPKSISVNNDKPDSLKQLKFWWGNANMSEQELFLQWTKNKP